MTPAQKRAYAAKMKAAERKQNKLNDAIFSQEDGQICDPKKLPDLRLVRKLVESGHTTDFICDFFGYDTDTFMQLQIAFPMFEKALDAWRVPANEIVEKALFQRAVGYAVKETKVMHHEGMAIKEDYIKTYPPDVKAAALWLTNKKPKEWTDRRDVTLSAGGDLADLIMDAREARKKKVALEGEADFLE